jgi:VanZ family protein
MLSFLLTIRQPYRIILLVLYAGAIVALSLMPPGDLPEVELFAGADKMIHFLMYFIFALLGCWSAKSESLGRYFSFVLPAAIGWGFFLEVLQLSMHLGRSFSWFDMLANGIGALVGIWCYSLVMRKS